MTIATAFTLSLLFTMPLPEPKVSPACDSTPLTCAQSNYAALYDSMEHQTYGSLLSIIWQRELSQFGSQSLGKIAWQAFWRNFFDRQAGGFFVRPGLDEYDVLMEWLATSDGFYGAYLPSLQPDMALFWSARRHYGYNPEWLSGQSYSHPSVWGVQCLAPGQTEHDKAWGYIVHVYDDGYTFDGDVREGVKYSYLTFIDAVGGRVPVYQCVT